MTQTVDSTAVTTTAPAPVAKSWEESGVAIETVGIARAMVASGYWKDLKNVAQAIVKIEMGRSMGVDPIPAIQYIHVFEASGRTAVQLGYPLVGMLIQRSGKYRYHVATSSASVAEVDFYRINVDGSERLLGRSRFTIEEAKTAGLLVGPSGNDKDVWKKWPRIMLYARALGHGARTFCPEVLGSYAVQVDQPYVESRVVGELAEAEPVGPLATDIEHEAPDEAIVVTSPAEDLGDPWARFWAQVKALGWTRERVHTFASVDQAAGSLAKALDIAAEAGTKGVPELLGDLLAAIREEDAAAASVGVKPAQEDDGERFQ